MYFPNVEMLDLILNGSSEFIWKEIKIDKLEGRFPSNLSSIIEIDLISYFAYGSLLSMLFLKI